MHRWHIDLLGGKAVKRAIAVILLATTAFAQIPKPDGGGGGTSGSGAGGALFSITVCQPGTCASDATPNQIPILLASATTIKCQMRAATAPSGGSLTMDLAKNGGSSIFASPVTITTGNNASAVTTSTATVVSGDYLIATFTGSSSAQNVVFTCYAS